MMAQSQTAKLLLLAIGLFLCAVIGVLLLNTKLLRIMADEQLFLHNAFSALQGWTEVEARYYPYAAYTKFHAFFLSLFEAGTVQDVVVLSKVFSAIPIAVLSIGLICYLFILAETPLTAGLYVVASILILLLFATTGRVLECRPEALAIPLYCGANLLVCFALYRRSGWVAEAVSVILFILVAWFTPRAAVIIVLTMPLYIWVLRDTLFKDLAKVVSLSMLAVGTISFLIWIFQINPLDIVSVFRSREAGLGLHRLPLNVKLFEQNRLVLLGLQLGAAVLVGVYGSKAKDVGTRRVAILAIGIFAAQLILVLIDPAPYEYAYSFGLAGVLLALVVALKARVSRMPMLVLVFAFGAFQSLHVLAPDGDRFGTQIHASYADRVSRDFEAMDIEALVGAFIASRGLHIQDQIDVNMALCDRVDGEVVAVFYMQPICSKSALEIEAYSVFIAHPDLDRGEPALEIILSALSSDETNLVLWGYGSPNPHLRATLQASPDWKVNESYALRQD